MEKLILTFSMDMHRHMELFIYPSLSNTHLDDYIAFVRTVLIHMMLVVILLNIIHELCAIQEFLILLEFHKNINIK